jgi:hypothetical protein
MRNIVPQLTNTINLRMMLVTRSGSTATVQNGISTPTGATPTADELAIAQTVIPPNQNGVIVTVSYTHTLVFFQKLMAPLLGASRTFSFTIAQYRCDPTAVVGCDQ